MKTLPEIDYFAVWWSLSHNEREAIGMLVVRAALMQFAGGEYQGDEPGTGVTYLPPDLRAEAWEKADELWSGINKTIQACLPDLFGRAPSPDHPNGTDPIWAAPIVSPIILPAAPWRQPPS